MRRTVRDWERRGFTFRDKSEGSSRQLDLIGPDGHSVGYLFEGSPGKPRLLRTPTPDEGIASSLFAKYLSITEGIVDLGELQMDNGLSLPFVLYLAEADRTGRLRYWGQSLSESREVIARFVREENKWVEVDASLAEAVRINAPEGRTSFIPVARYILDRGVRGFEAPGWMIPYLRREVKTLKRFWKNPPRFIRTELGNILDYRDWVYNYEDERPVPAVVDPETYQAAASGTIRGVYAR